MTKYQNDYDEVYDYPTDEESEDDNRPTFDSQEEWFKSVRDRLIEASKKLDENDELADLLSDAGTIIGLAITQIAVKNVFLKLERRDAQKAVIELHELRKKVKEMENAKV
jgi:hypothetical protein